MGDLNLPPSEHGFHVAGDRFERLRFFEAVARDEVCADFRRGHLRDDWSGCNGRFDLRELFPQFSDEHV